MRFVSYNIQYGIGLDGRFDPERIAASIGDADIIALQEVTRGFHRNDHVDLVARFGKLFPGHFAVFHAPCDIDIGSAIEDGRPSAAAFNSAT